MLSSAYVLCDLYRYDLHGDKISKVTVSKNGLILDSPDWWAPGNVSAIILWQHMNFVSFSFDETSPFIKKVTKYIANRFAQCFRNLFNLGCISYLKKIRTLSLTS